MANEEDIRKIREIMECLFKQNISEKLNKLNDTEKKIYELTGEKVQSEIVKSLKIAPNTISNTWKKLENEGLLIKDGKGYRKVI